MVLINNYEGLQTTIAVLLFIARVGDVGSTYLVTPSLKLEANPIARRFKWPFAMLTVFTCLLPYWSVSLGIALLVTSLLVSASNSSKIWLARTLGEKAYFELVARAASQAPLKRSIFFILLPAFFMALLGGTLMCLYPNPARDWAYHVALGIIVYAIAIGLYGPLMFLRLRKLPLAS